MNRSRVDKKTKSAKRPHRRTKKQAAERAEILQCLDNVLRLQELQSNLLKHLKKKLQNLNTN